MLALNVTATAVHPEKDRGREEDRLSSQPILRLQTQQFRERGRSASALVTCRKGHRPLCLFVITGCPGKPHPNWELGFAPLVITDASLFGQNLYPL